MSCFHCDFVRSFNVGHIEKVDLLQFVLGLDI